MQQDICEKNDSLNTFDQSINYDKTVPASRLNKKHLLVTGLDIAMQLQLEGSDQRFAHWGKMLTEMAHWCIQQHVIEEQGAKNELYELVQKEAWDHLGHKIEKYLPEESKLQDCLKEIFRHNTPQLTKVHSLLARIPFSGYISTSYDLLLETAYKQENRSQLPKFYTSSIQDAVKTCQQEQPFILKLYGDVETSDSLIFRHNWPHISSDIYGQALHSLLTQSPILFFGFDDHDPAYIYLYNIVAKHSRFEPTSILSFLPQEEQYQQYNSLWINHGNQESSITLSRMSTSIAILEPPSLKVPSVEVNDALTNIQTTTPPRPLPNPSQSKTDNASRIEVFMAYVHTKKDNESIERVKEIISILEWQQERVFCFANDVACNSEWTEDNHLETAKLIILLITPNFLNTKFCYCSQMKDAVEKHKVREIRIVPIILRPASAWKNTSFGNLPHFPEGKGSINQVAKSSELARDLLFDELSEYIRKELGNLA